MSQRPSSYARKKIKRQWDAETPGNRRSAIVLWLIVQQNLSKTELRVVLYLAMRWDLKNRLPLSQEEIADELGMKPSHVTTAIKGLMEKQLVARNTRTKPYKHRIKLETIEQTVRRGS